MAISLPYVIKDNSAVMLMPLRFGNEKTTAAFVMAIEELPQFVTRVVLDCKLLQGVLPGALTTIGNLLLEKELGGSYQNANDEIAAVISDNAYFKPQVPVIVLESTLLGPQ